MEILSVALKNFKSHRDAYFEFQPGTNAICGENGAGKTSILEAIAWGLFNYKGAYKSEDLIHNGAASGQVCISFISNLDGRTYEVQRCTSKGYQVYDPQLQAKLELNRIDEDIIPWLRQHLGVSPGTDLARLFANTVGVPQGTFTADFLKPPRERKATFDAMLKVEEYRQVYENFASLEKYAKAEAEKLEQAIAQYNESLQDLEPLQARYQELNQETEQIKTVLQQCQARLGQLEHEKAELTAQAERVQQLTNRLETLTAQIQSQRHLRDRLDRELQQAQQAVAICQANQAGYQQFLQAEAALQHLEHRRHHQQQLLEQRQAQREVERDRATHLATLKHQLERLDAIQTEREQLAPLVEQQTGLEQQQQAVLQQLQACRSHREAAQLEIKRLQQVQARLAKLEPEIAEITALKGPLQQIPVLEQQQQRYQQQLSRVEAARQFEAELRQITRQNENLSNQYATQVQQAQAAVAQIQQAMPLFSDALQPVLTALSTSTQLNQRLLSPLQAILQDLSAQTSSLKLEQQLQQVQQQLQALRQQQLRSLKLDTLVNEQANLNQQADELRTSLSNLQTRLAVEPELQQQQSRLARDLAALNNPRGLQYLYQKELQQRPQIETQYRRTKQRLQETQAAIAELDAHLLDFADLAVQVQMQQTRRESQRAAYQTYLEHQQLANCFKDRQSEQAGTMAQLQNLEREAKTVETESEQLAQAFNIQHFEAVQSACKQLETQKITLGARLPEIIKRLQDVERQLTNLKTLQHKRDQAQIELKQRDKVKHFITFARKAYKQAGPRITERYVQSISREADKLFRELLNRQNVALEWTRDYEIVVQEGAHPRRFINLSGGEQMCAALAVRLALLKVLADIDIAFFDEPTTNMDRPRREQLAEAIANIKTFRQLFVISHDETFEKVTGNVVLVKRQVE